MTAYTKIGGEWKEFDPNVKVNGSWYPVDNGYVKVNGVWKEFYNGFIGLTMSFYQGDTNRVSYTSTDLVTWTNMTLPAVTDWQQNWHDASTNGNVICVFGPVGYFATSSNKGISWTTKTAPSTTTRYRATTYGGGRFVALGYYSNQAMYSSDSITWSASTLPSSNPWASVAYGNDRFVATAGLFQWSRAATYSTNGVTWQASTMPYNAPWTTTKFGSGIFASAGGWFPDGGMVASSTNGVTWTVSTTSTGFYLSMEYGNGYFVLPKHNTNIIYRSSNATSWTAYTTPTITNKWAGVVYDSVNEKWGILPSGSGQNSAASSTDLITWTISSRPTVGTLNNFRTIKSHTLRIQ